jgi:hypothetical protein
MVTLESDPKQAYSNQIITLLRGRGGLNEIMAGAPQSVPAHRVYEKQFQGT